MATYDLTSNIPTPSSLRYNDILNCPYSGDKVTITLPVGEYKLECWGAQGGNYNSSATGGAGGYSTGILTLTEETILYLYAGGQPASTNASGVHYGGFNGGGNGIYTEYETTWTSSQGGGGGTDIRIGQDSLYARVIVAGGGGGSGEDAAFTYKYGGGETGGSGSGQSGYGGTQTAGGGSGDYAGSFGIGGSTSTSTNYNYAPGGGGGGWYGGGSAGQNDNQSSYHNKNGGGSGYVYTSATAVNYPSGCLLNNSYYLGSASTVAGNQSFTDYDGTTVTGHQGNGAIRITVNTQLTPVAIPTLGNKTYTGTSQSPTETNYNATYMTKTGEMSAVWPGTYTICYTLNWGYIWEDETLTPKYVSWKITSPWKKKQPYIMDSSTTWSAKTPWIYDSNFTL